jgi:hypothetical protein
LVCCRYQEKSGNPDRTTWKLPFWSFNAKAFFSCAFFHVHFFMYIFSCTFIFMCNFFMYIFCISRGPFLNACQIQNLLSREKSCTDLRALTETQGSSGMGTLARPSPN